METIKSLTSMFVLLDVTISEFYIKDLVKNSLKFKYTQDLLITEIPSELLMKFKDHSDSLKMYLLIEFSLKQSKSIFSFYLNLNILRLFKLFHRLDKMFCLVLSCQNSIYGFFFFFKLIKSGNNYRFFLKINVFKFFHIFAYT